MVLLLLLALLAGGLPAQQQGGQDQEVPKEFYWTTVVIRVRSAWGTQLPGFAVVRLSSISGSYDRTESTRENGEATFQRVNFGNYVAEITSPGFRPAREDVWVNAAGDPLRVVINLQPAPEPGAAATPTPIPALTAKAQREIDSALQAMRSKDAAAAKQRLAKAAKLAPQHPDPAYLMGLLYVQLNDAAQAKVQFEKAVALYPGHARALTALGEIAIRQGDYQGAVRLLGRAVDQDASSWRSQVLLANALLPLKEFERALLHAERTLDLAKGKSADARLIAAQALLGLGEQDRARAHLEAFVREWPDDPRAGTVKGLLERAQPAQQAAASPIAAVVPSPADIPPEQPEPAAKAWAPPDVDQTSPPVASDVPCVLPSVLEAASQRAQALAGTLERIVAREDVEHALLDGAGDVRSTESGDFSYLATIRQYPQRLLTVSESREGRVPFNKFSSGIAASGLAAMALVFHPFYAPNFEMRCEGLGDWKGQPSWLVHFRQNPDRHSNFYSYRTPQGTYQIPLKGRAWIATNTGDVLRIEIDAFSVPEVLQLTRNHLTIDYGPVTIDEGKIRLWLPSRVELYSEYKGRRHRVRHTFSDFHLFTVRSEQKVQPPSIP